MSYRHKHIKHKIHKIKPRKPILTRPIFGWLVLALAVISLIFYGFFVYSGLQIKNIEISGNEKLKTRDISNFVGDNIAKRFFWISPRTKNILFIDVSELSAKISQKFPEIESVEINKEYPQTLRLQVVERKPVATFCGSVGATEEKCFLTDANGIVFEQLASIPENLAVLHQILEQEPFLGERLVDKNIMDAINGIEKSLKDKFQIDITEALISNPLKLDIITSENWRIYFDSSADINPQILKLSLLLEGEIPASARQNLQYIDLRFKDKAYYK